MKHTTLIALMVLFAGMAHASAPANGNPTKPDRLKSQIDRHVVFPTAAVPDRYGEVEATFRINERGETEIIETRSVSEYLADYVAKKLEKVRLGPNDKNLGQVIRYRFVFQKQD
jgi:hypothetical protein